MYHALQPANLKKEYLREQPAVVHSGQVPFSMG